MQLSSTLREYLQQESESLAENANYLWQISRPIHERQNRPDSNENGPEHVEAVERNIWRLLQSTVVPNKANHLEDFSAFELFLLSCIACCHDFDKALKSALPDGFIHGKGSGDFVLENSKVLGLSRTQAKAIQNTISIHDLGNEEFRQKLRELNINQGSPIGPYNQQRLAVLLKAADILHCDNSRILALGIDPTKLDGIDRKKYLSRNCTNGWYSDGRRIIIQADPDKEEEAAACVECFEYMKKVEWPAVSDALERYHFPYQLETEPEIYGSKDALKDYLKSIVTDTNRIDIKGIFSRSGAGREAIHFPIEEIYTPLKTIKNRHDMYQVERLIEKTDYSEGRVPLTELLSAYRKLLIVGEPGGGKTTFLRFIACVLSKDALGESEPKRGMYLGLSLDDDAPIPILMKMASLAEIIKSDDCDGGCGSSWRPIVKALEAFYGQRQSELLQKLLDKGRCALLLDGLDEVAEDRIRNRIVEVVNAILNRWGDNMTIISSRPFGYHDIADLEQIATVQIDAFGDKEIIDFLNRWGQGLYPDKEERKDNEYLSELQSAIIKSAPIRRLARNPVMLTCLCVVHWNERKLPEGKADLLAAVLRWLLNAREDIRNKRGHTNIFAEECIKALAFSMTLHPEGKKVIVDLGWAADQLKIPFSDILSIEDEDRVRREGMSFLKEEMLDSGIVEKYGTGQLRFWHLNFQEHYAARAMVDRSDDAWWQIIEPHLYDNQFSEVLEHLAGCLAWTGLFRLNLLVEKILSTASQDDLTSIARAVGVLGRILRILAVYDYQPPARLGWQDAQGQVMEIFDTEGAAKVPVEERIAAAEALGQAGDPRINPLDPQMLPIPGITDVLLGKYLVTVEEYSRFIENRGYAAREFWEGWWKIREKEGWTEPYGWDEQIEHLNRPVTGISWYEAMAYCNWLSEQTGLSFRLPKSKEWEKAARNPKGDYPWGRKEPNSELLNFNGNVGRPTPIGVYPAGAAPGGHLDMAGNVLEWNWDFEKAGPHRMVRGGGWYDDARLCRSAIRNSFVPDFRDSSLGFRLARSIALGS